MAFGFLSNIVHDVGHDVSTVARGNNNPGGGVFGFLKGTAVSTAKAAAQTGAGLVNTELTGHPTSGAAQASLPQPIHNFIGNPNAHQLAGSAIQTAALVVGGPAFKVAEKAIEPLASGVVSHVAAGAISQAPVGAAFNVGSAVQSGQPFNFLKTAGEGAAIGGALGAAGPLVGAGVKGIKSAHDTAVANASAVENAAKRVPQADQKVLQDFSDYENRTYNPTMPELNKLLQDVRVVGPKYGIDLVNGTRADHIDAANSVLDQIGKNRSPQGGFVNIPSKNVADKLVQSSTPEDAYKTLTDNGIDPSIARRIAPAVAHTKDPNIISNIIDKAHSPAPSPADIINARTPVGAAENSAGQGTLDNLGQSEAANKEAINSHLQTIRNAESTGPELQQAIKGLAQTHTERDTQLLSDQAKQAVEKDYTGSLAKVLTNENPSDKDVALAAHLVTKAQDDAAAAKAAGDTATHDSKIAEAVTIAEKTDLTLREAGRTAQAGSIIGRLSPEGILQYATRKLRQVRELNPKNAEKEVNTAKKIKETVESAKPNLDKKTISGIVDEATKATSKTEKSTGEQIASKVAKAASPQRKAKVDQLVNEIVKKVKQEHLEPRVTARKAPLDIIKEVMGRNPEAQEAYPEAQQILKEKYAGNEPMQEALDKFFNSKLGTPVAGTTFERAISDQLKTNNLKIPDIIKQSISKQHYTQSEIVSDLTKEGFDQESANTVAKEVSTRLQSKVAEAKRTTLENLAKDVKSRNQPTVLEKINKFSNLGALSNEDYLHLARAKLNFPHLTTETAGKIHDLSQKLQDLPEGHEKYAAVREIQHLIQNEIPRSKADLAKELIGLPRTILASGDFSFGARQGIVYATSHPIEFAKAWPKQFAYFKQAFAGSDSEAYDAMMADIRNNKYYQDLEKDVRLQEPTGHSTALRQEQFISSDLAEKIPLIGRLVRASNYAYTGLGNYLKANQYYAMREHLDYGNIPYTEDMANKLGEVINTSLGRGGKKGGFTEEHSGFLSTALFAPRLIASRINVMNPAYYIRLDGPARQEALRGLLGLSAFATGILGLAKLAGADVSTDPRSSDFGKVKIGDTRLDPLAGFSQYIRLGTQIITGQKINSTTGAQTEAGKGFAGSRLDIASNFVQGKENPSISFVTTMLKGKDINGNDLYNFKGVSSQVIQRFIPLLGQDIADLQSHPNAVNGSVPGKVGAAAAGLFGVGLQTYGAQDEPIAPKQQEYIQQLQKQGADKATIKANTEFFQTLKTISGTRTQVSASIKKALKNGDTPKAQQLATDYNQKLTKGIAPWNKQYGSYANNDLQQAFDHVKINLTSTSINARLKASKSTKPY